MKNLKYRICFMLILFALFGCQEDEFGNASGQSAEVQKIINFIAENYSENVDDLRYDGDVVVTKQNDVEFPIENFWEIYGVEKKHIANESLNTRTYQQDPNLVTTTDVITIGVLNSVPFAWRLATYKACQNWNSLNGELQFVYTQANYRDAGVHDIWVYRTGISPITTIARATSPSNNGSPGWRIRINKNYSGYLSADDKEFAMTHEIGHNIGFEHTDSNNGNEITGLSMNCSSNNNPKSLMRSTLFAVPDRDFTNCDEEAYLEIYPN